MKQILYYVWQLIYFLEKSSKKKPPVSSHAQLQPSLQKLWKRNIKHKKPNFQPFVLTDAMEFLWNRIPKLVNWLLFMFKVIKNNKFSSAQINNASME